MPWTGFGRAARPPARPVALLGLAQTLAWASSFYLPAVLARPMAAELGLAPATVYLAFSIAMLVSALVGPAAGRAIDRLGGRPVLMATNGVFALALVGLALAQGPISLFAAWALLGVAMGAGLYEAAFATLVRLYGSAARDPITGITLIAGFASTVGWPLTAWMLDHHGWRGACLGWAGLHLLVGLPLNALLPRHTAAPPPPASTTAPAAVPSPPAPPRPAWTAALLSAFFALGMFIGTACATHMPQLLQTVGATMAVAITAGALIGPAQVAGRLLEFGFLRRWHPLRTARIASLAHPLGIALLLLLGAPAAAAFALLHGAGNGILTIAKGTLPLVLFGPQGYGARQGWLMLPARIAQACAPVAFGLALDHGGRGALWLSATLGALSCGMLLLIRLHPEPDAAPPPR